MENKFISWLNNELNERKWTNAELSRQADIAPSYISMVISGQQKPGFEFCVKVADAFDEPPERILRLAGLLPPLPGPEDSPTLRDLIETARRLDPDERLRLVGIAHLFLREQRARYYSSEDNSDSDDTTTPATAR